MDNLYDGFDVEDANTSTGDDENTTSRTTSFNMGDAFRPMTSNKSAGYSSQMRNNVSNSSKYKKATHNNRNKNVETSSQTADKMEKQVNKLLKESIFYSSSGDYDNALHLAQNARKKERQVIAFREKNNLDDNTNTDLTFSVLFNLGYIYELKEMHSEALNIYNSMMNDNNNNELSSRLRVNMGNIYYKQNKYDLAIKMYRMSLDQIGDTNCKLKINIMRNIGNSFIKLSQFVDAIQAYETVVELHSVHRIYDVQTIFNLIIAYYTLGDKERMKKGFIQLLNCSSFIANHTNEKEETDEYAIYIKRKWLELAHCIKQTVQLIGKAIANNNDEYSGYEWLIAQLKQSKDSLNKDIMNKIIVQVIVSKGIAYLNENRFQNAIQIFSELRDDVHHNNLAFLNFLKGEYGEANKYASSAVTCDRYNALALVNRANCLYVFGEYESAKEMYLEAIGVEADCIEAIYNLGLICKKLANYNDALQAFKKLNKIDCDARNGSSRDPQVLYQISHLYELLNDYDTAIKWYKILYSVVPTDATILIKLANLYKIYVKDESLIYHNYIDAYKLFKCDINIISWLGIWYINNSLYENAIRIFDNAYLIQPSQTKWKLMIASCYRRMRNLHKSIHIYLEILDESTETTITIKCLQYLCTIMKEMDHPDFDKYQTQLKQIQNHIDMDMDMGIDMSTEDIKPQHNDQDTNDTQEDNNWDDVHLDDELLPF
eukprot:444774_1